MSDSDHDPTSPDTDEPGEILSLHVGPSANCSSVGSFVDFLFVSSVVGAAALGAFAVLVRRRAGEPEGEGRDGPESASQAEAEAEAEAEA